MKRAVLTVVAALLAGTALATTPSSPIVAALPSATPAALQYDEITRVLIPPATPPPPGTFQADYAIASQSHQSKGGGIFSMVKHAEEQLKQIQSGRVTRYTINGAKGLFRSDDITDQTATISNCQTHQVISLNLAAKTYRIENNSPQVCPTGASAADTSTPPDTSGSNGAKPGTGDLTFTVTSSNLGPQTIEGIATNGVTSSFEMKMTNATGSCQNMDATMQSTRYASEVQRPRAYCPIKASPASAGPPMDPTQMIFGQGCKPRIHGQGNVLTPFSTPSGDTLDMYSVFNFGAGGHKQQPMNMLSEIGNVTWLKGADADAAFAIPAGFTEQK